MNFSAVRKINFLFKRSALLGAGLVLIFLFSEPLLAQKRTRKPALKKSEKNEKNEAWFQKNLERVKRQYRLGEISDRQAWQMLSKLYNYVESGQFKANASELLQTQAYILQKAKLPLLAAKYASWALSSASDPYAKELVPSWELLDQISEQQQIHDILTELASNLIKQEKAPPRFERNWFYFLAEAYLQRNDADHAIKFLEKLDITDRYYMSARFELAMTYLNAKEDLNRAGLILKSMISNDAKEFIGVKESVRRDYTDQAYLGLGRIQYERQKFVSSAKYYRMVRRNSAYYYNALFEQSWAFFMAGYPNHSLGGLHAVDSPFFPGRFNPESAILRSIIYYWLCRYDDAKTSLADFIENYSEPVNDLENWLNQKSLNPEKAYALFENLMSGVSSQSLGIDRRLLESVSKTPPMVFARERLATVLAEKGRLSRMGVFRSKKENRVPLKILDQWLGKLTLELGKVYIAELESLRDDYRNLRSQANFIYIELLMSEKEQALGRELHSEEKIDKLSMNRYAKGWGQGNMPWKASDKGEYWWDEIGFFVYQVQPMCNENP